MKSKDKTDKADVAPVKGDSKTTALLLLTMADTTWRVFTPVILFAGLGIWADLNGPTRPWLTFLGVVAGFAVAAVLVKSQIVKIRDIK